MNLEERLQALLIEREETLTRMEEAVQQIQHLLMLWTQQKEHEHRIRRIKRYF